MAYQTKSNSRRKGRKTSKTGEKKPAVRKRNARRAESSNNEPMEASVIE